METISKDATWNPETLLDKSPQHLVVGRIKLKKYLKAKPLLFKEVQFKTFWAITSSNVIEHKYFQEGSHFTET